jgi:hypothetical protein
MVDSESLAPAARLRWPPIPEISVNCLGWHQARWRAVGRVFGGTLGLRPESWLISLGMPDSVADATHWG